MSKVCITTVQRLYAMLRGEALDFDLEAQSLATLDHVFGPQPKPISYNADLPISAPSMSSSLMNATAPSTMSGARCSNTSMPISSA